MSHAEGRQGTDVGVRTGPDVRNGPSSPDGSGAGATVLVVEDEPSITDVRVHTPADAPVTLGVERQDGAVRLRVADQGPGLAEADAARVFGRFFRAGGGAGSGLGMAIVQGVVAAHGGEVGVVTAPGAGHGDGHVACADGG